MSSPLDRKFNPDEPSPYAPKWVREAAQSDRRTEPPVFEDAEADDFRRSAAALGSDEGLMIERYRVPRSLEPTTVPGPSYLGVQARSVVGTVVRFGGAGAIAAVIALLVVGKFPLSWPVTANSRTDPAPAFGSRFVGQPLGANGASATGTDQSRAATPQLVIGHAAPRGQGEAAPLGVALSTASSGALVVVDGLTTGSTLNVGRSAGSTGWRLMASDLPNALIRPPQGFVGGMDLAVALRLADDSIADRKLVRLEWSAPVPVATQAMKPGFVFRNLDRDEIDALVKRGEDFIASGDLAAARLVLQRAAEGGDAGAALTLAGTYDPLVLEKLGVQGLSADVAKARAWYERAKEFGSTEAPRRLEMLASRDR